ncbi:excalibur calcium-binding domain-containing protein [Paracoccus contaminans]|nr:excalibur calcium-binding domain-containing protein [Paracoccus contaminans]
MAGKFGWTAAAMVAALLTTLPDAGHAHPGGLNAEGCHRNRKTGDFHCHGGGTRKAASGNGAVPRLYDAASGGGAFRNCAEARRAGAAPVRRGDPGYAPRLDRDGDGTGCE